MSMPAAQARRPPKLMLDRKYGPAPNPGGKYRNATHFKKMYRAYQWTQGHDVCVALDRPEQVRLVCAANANCPFSITAEFTTFTEAPLTGQTGFKLSTQVFRPDHDHAAPFLPLDEATENARIAPLAHDDPSIDNPPLVPAQGFATSSSGGGSGVGGAPGGFATSSVASGLVHAAPPQQQQHRASFPGAGANRMSPSVGPAATPTPSGASTYMQHTPLSAASAVGGSGAPPGPAYPPAPALAPASALTPQQQSQLALPLGKFLYEISPQFAAHFNSFEANSIPLSTPPQDLVDLDTGRPDDRTLFDLFKDVRGLSPLLVAVAADGVRKAKLRQLQSGNQDVVDPRIAIGLEKTKAERWVQGKIAQGLVMMQQTPQARL
ncbi:hypothetical protein JCM10449v2_007704 [Rhodotorula kratochvilovae]